MPAIFSKNCILAGEIDLYCLACCVYLTAEDDALSHIQGSTHKDIIKFLGYFERHEQDFIRKVNGIYFCEVCNLTLSTATKVKIHVTEEAHLAGKKSRAMRRTAHGGVVLPCGVAVSEDAWHGLVDDTCVLCSVESVDDTHTRNKPHVINLINSKVVIGPGGDAYRKIDDAYQCLTCNQIVSEQLLTEHLNSNDHKSLFVKDDKQNDVINSNKHISKDNKKVHIEEKTSKDDKPPKIDENVKNPNQQNERKVSESIKTLAKKCGLIIKDINVHCSICNIEISATTDDIKVHMNSQKHLHNKTLQTKTQDMPKIKKVNINEFVRVIQSVETLSGIRYVMLNDTLCIYFHSFLGLNVFRNKIICEFCNIDLVPENVASHVNSKTHFDLIINTSVIASLKGEFVRQIKSDMYHCGFCGVTENDYDDMLDHLVTSEHNSRKTELKNTLMNFQLQLLAGRTHQHVFTNYDFLTLRNSGFFNDILF